MKKYPTNQERTSEYSKIFTRQKVLSLLVKNETPLIFDVGANNGRSLNEFKQWWPQSEVHCFEPQEECWAELESCATRYSNTIINKIATSSKNGTLDFYTHDISTGLSGSSKINLDSGDSIFLNKLENKKGEKKLDYTKTINRPRQVPSQRMDSYMNENNITHIDFLKIDTQGHEPEVLSSFADKLKNVHVVMTELMFYDYYEKSLSFSDIEKILHPAGFRLYDINHIAKNPMNGRTDWVDVIYLNKDFM
jgi:FkbM family methyltransferase